MSLAIFGLMSFLLGLMSYLFYSNVRSAIWTRRHYGKKVMVGSKIVGNTIVLRYRGSKKFAYVDCHGDLSKQHFYEREEAESECKEVYLKQAPKQTSFARAI